MQRTPVTKLLSTCGQKLLQSNQPKVFSSLPKKCLLARSEHASAPCFSTPGKGVHFNNGSYANTFLQNPAKLFTRRAEEEAAKYEELGWAGQPIVKRIHTILPEIHGDTSDVLKVAKISKNATEIPVSNNLEVQVRNFGNFGHDIISVENEIPSIANKLNNVVNTARVGNRRLHTRRAQHLLYSSGISSRNVKVKRRKRTVVLGSKASINKNYFPQTFDMKPKQHKWAWSDGRQYSTKPLSNSVYLVTNRQFQTSTALCKPKAALAKKIEPLKGNKSNTAQEDCVCPEILYTTGKRKSTKICGEASGIEQKKKSSWKQKMCPAQPIEKPGQGRTLVCLSAAFKVGKKKKEEKCPVPEKPVAPRVIICPPNYEEEEAKKGKAECIKIEEVKIRKRTQVCKPVLIFAKEEAAVHVEKKAVCVSNLKRIVSRHTKICPPPDADLKKKSILKST